MKQKFSFIIQGIFIVVLFLSCVSNKNNSRLTERTVKRYTSFNFAISFLFPKQWSVFESDVNIRISNKKDLLVFPKDFQVITEKTFLGNLYISDISELRQLFFLQINIPSKEVMISKEKFVEIQNLPLLKNVVSDEYFTKFVNLYNFVTLAENIDKARVFVFDENTAGIVSSYVRKIQKKNIFFLKLIFLHSINKEYVAIYSSDYNTGIRKTGAGMNKNMVLGFISNTLFFNRTKDMMLSLELLSLAKDTIIPRN